MGKARNLVITPEWGLRCRQIADRVIRIRDHPDEYRAERDHHVALWAGTRNRSALAWISLDEECRLFGMGRHVHQGIIELMVEEASG